MWDTHTHTHTHTHTQNGIYYSAIKKNETMPFATIWMEGTSGYAKWNKSEKKKKKINTIWSHLHVEFLKTKNLGS